MSKPKISVLMPVYNAAKYLREAMDSILNQTFIDFEFIIINDASTDNSKQIIMSYNDQRIRYFENAHNLGVARSLNKGLKHAKARYIARMDADDISYPQRLSVQYHAVVNDESVALVASSYEMIDELGKYLCAVRGASSSEEIFYNLQFHNCLAHPTVIFNRHIILNAFHGYKNCEAEDYDLWLRISKKYKILKIDKVLHQLRISKTSRVSKFNIEIKNSALKIAHNNLQTIIAKSININIIKIFANLSLLGSSSQNTKEVFTILNEINYQIINKSPQFLEKRRLSKLANQKKYSIKFRRILSPILYIYRLVNSYRYKVSL